MIEVHFITDDQHLYYIQFANGISDLLELEHGVTKHQYPKPLIKYQCILKIHKK